MGLIWSVSFCAEVKASRSSRPVTHAHFLHISLDVTGYRKGQLAGSPGPVHGCGLLRQFHKFTAGRSDQHAIICLKISSNLAKGDLFVGGIEEQERPEFGMLYGGDQRGIGQAIRQLDGDNNMVECARIRRRLPASPSRARR